MRIDRFDREKLKEVLNENVMPKLMCAYKRVFEGPPWFEKWELEEVKKVIKETILEKESVKGEIMFLKKKEKEEELIGFIWGYKFVENGKPVTSPTVDFESVIAIMRERGYEPEVSFYLAEFGILPEKQNNGYGYTLLKDFVDYLKENGEDYMFYRTINTVVIYLSEKLERDGKVKKFKRDLFTDPRYPKRKWQLVIL